MFEDNQYSALYLTSGRAVFDENFTVVFQSNRGIKGGAVAIHGFSAFVVNDHSRFVFINNSAVRVGGGIYYGSIDQREYFNGQTCFLEYGGKQNNISRRDISFRFDGIIGWNVDLFRIYFSCYFYYYEETKLKVNNLTKIFDRIGNFHFDAQHSKVMSLGTAARKVEFNEHFSMQTLPGKSLYLPLLMYDEFETIMNPEFGLRIEDNDLVELDNFFIVNSRIRVFGVTNQNATLVLSTPQQLYNVEYMVGVTLLPCPPGFYYNLDMKQCSCSSDSKLHSYPAIMKCDYVNFTAFIKRGYWVGYYPSHSKNENDLYTAFYPSIFNNSDSISGLQQITANSNSLSDFMCGSSREGVVCGTCKRGYTAYYHSRQITCGKIRLCKFGILFYLLSEIIPIVIFFTIVITLGISFSSGAMNGFVFFSQVIDVFSQDLIFSQSYDDTKVLHILQAGYKLIYGTFNIEFFSVFPFCLWEGATILDVLAFKYITTTFALLLVTTIVVMMNYSSIKRCSWMCEAKGWRKDSSVTHGISTFLIICYGQYTIVSFFILTKTYLQGKSGVKPIPVT